MSIDLNVIIIITVVNVTEIALESLDTFSWIVKITNSLEINFIFEIFFELFELKAKEYDQ